MKNLLLYKNWNLFTKVFSLAVIIIIPVLLFFFFEFIPSVETKLVSEKQRNVKNAVEVAYGVLEEYNELYQNGDMTLDEAKAAAAEVIKDIRYEGEEYFWINNLNLVMIMHPIKKNLNNTSIADTKDPKGKYLFREMVKVAQAQGEGYVNYMWPKPGFTEPVPKTSFVKAFESWGWLIGSGIYIDDVESDLAAFRNEIILFMIIIGVVALLLGYFTARTIANPIKRLEKAAAKVAEGDTSVQVDANSNDEVGVLSASFNKMVNKIKDAIDEVTQKGKEAGEAAEQAKIAQKQAVEQQEYLARNTKVLLTEMERFSGGDLTVKVTPENEEDDIGKLFNGFNSAVTKIKDMIGSVTSAIQSTASTSTQISKSSEEMAAGVQQQSVQSEEVSSAVEEMSKTITEIAHNATSANDSSNHSKQQTESGAEAIEKSKAGFEKIIESAKRTGEIIGSLTAKTSQINQIIDVINEIADQTNLLALNAAIEAARAGEDGRGFAVVADEVKKLAERTTNATQEIADTIKTVQKEANEANESMSEAHETVEEGKRLNDEVEQTLKSINESTKNVNIQITQLAASSEQQSTTAEEISKNIESISEVSSQTAVEVQQIAQAAETLNEMTKNLQNLISQFYMDKAEDSSNYTEHYKKTA